MLSCTAHFLSGKGIMGTTLAHSVQLPVFESEREAKTKSGSLCPNTCFQLLHGALISVALVQVSLRRSSSNLWCVCSSQTSHNLRMTITVVRTPAKKTPTVCHVGVPKWERIPSYKNINNKPYMSMCRMSNQQQKLIKQWRINYVQTAFDIKLLTQPPCSLIQLIKCSRR